MKLLYFQIIIFTALLLSQGCGLMGHGIDKPAVRKNPEVTDGEYTVYYAYENGEFNHVTHFVSRLDKDSNITMYAEGTNLFEKIKKLPENYTDYQYTIKFSFKYGTLIQSKNYWLHLAKLENSNGIVGHNLMIDVTNLRAITELYYWDGEKLKTSISRMDLKAGYSYWDINSFGLIGMRFFDPAKGGIIYIIAADSSKEPIPVSFRYYGEETVNVPAGTFKTKKYGFTIADQFLNGLLGKFASQYMIWIEDSPRALMIQSTSMDNIEFKLAKIGIWK